MNAPMEAPVPPYLAEVPTDGHMYGSVDYDPTLGLYALQCEPAVMEVAKRLFPGKKRGKTLKFRATRRITGDLNWFLLRYPMTVKCKDQFGADKQKAIDFANLRTKSQQMAPVWPDAGFIGQLLDYQAEGVGYLTTNQRTLLADDMGLGKTVTALATLAHINVWPVVVVVPNPFMQRQWQKMVEGFLSVSAPGSLFGNDAHIIKGRKSYSVPHAPIYVIHYGLIAYWWERLLDMNPKVVIFDEIQELRHTGTAKYTAASHLSTACDFAWGLSGTPIYNYGNEMWAVMNAIEYHCLGDEEGFSMEWCTGYGAKVVEKPAVLGDYLRREGLMLRRTKDEVQSQLPKKRRLPVDVDHDESLYNRMIKPAVDMARGYEKITSFVEKGQTVREVENMARLATGVAKASQVADFVETLIAGGEYPLVFAYHHEVHDILTERLGRHGLSRITGKESQLQKDEGIRRFASGTHKAVLLSLRSTAGLDGLQGKGTCVVFAELDWSPAVHSQCEDRLHRIGTTAESLLCYYIVSNTGFDSVMRDVLGLKVGQFSGIMGEAPPATDDELGRQAAEGHMKRVMDRLRGAAA